MKDKLLESTILGVVLSVTALTLAVSAHAQTGDIARGKTLYQKECAICHGTEGRGDGFTARFLDPKPRDFTRGVFKIRSTLFLPTDEDLIRTLTRGIPGTLMPSFEDLTEDERRDLVAYVKTFSEMFETEMSDPIPIPEPPPQTQQHLVEGEMLYAKNGCGRCHGPLGRGDGPSASSLEDEWGDPISAYDFTIPGRMKGGSTVRDVYRAFYVGIGGTPMPAFEDALTEEQYWALAYYILSLTDEAPSQLLTGNALIGRDLFTGSARFENGGSACIACHSVTGIGALGGGVMGPDLTRAYNKFSEYGITSVLTRFPFPVMYPLYEDHSLTQQEMAHVTTFLEQAVALRPVQALGQLAALAVSGAVFLFGLMHLIWRRRLRGVRRPLVELSA